MTKNNVKRVRCTARKVGKKILVTTTVNNKGKTRIY